jgi:hypothetical protein
VEALQACGLTLDENLLWWGGFAALQRVDEQFSVFDPERRARLDRLARIGNESPANLTPRDRAFYMGLVTEAAAAVEAQRGGAP